MLRSISELSGYSPRVGNLPFLAYLLRFCASELRWFPCFTQTFFLTSSCYRLETAAQQAQNSKARRSEGGEVLANSGGGRVF